MYTYTNGNYKVSILSDGTKIREGATKFKPSFPESIDIKITNMCDLMCPYCHEGSIPSGKHADINEVLLNLSGLPAGVEVAIGGGNPCSHPDLYTFLTELRKQGIIPNITINARHLSKYDEFLRLLILKKVIYGVGVSYDGEHFFDTPNTIYHVIAGVYSIHDIKSLITAGRKVLILGYKQKGRGKRYYRESIEKRLEEIKYSLWEVIGRGFISFDNLAIEQLNVKNFFTQMSWKKRYMGNDGEFTMYYNAVDEYYAASSVNSPEMPSNISIIDYWRRSHEDMH